MINKEKLNDVRLNFFAALGATFLWCIATFLIIVAFIVLSKPPTMEYGIYLFYAMLVMHIFMISNVSNKLKIFKRLYLFRRIGNCNFKYVIKYSLFGIIFGVLCDIIVVVSYIPLIIMFSFSAFGASPSRLYKENLILYMGIIVLIVEFLLCFLAGIKEGIRYETKNNQ